MTMAPMTQWRAVAAGAALAVAACSSSETGGGGGTQAAGGNGTGGSSSTSGTAGSGAGTVDCGDGPDVEIYDTSGPIEHGSQVTLQGCRFGEKQPAPPLKWDDFESGTDGEDIGNGWLISRGGGDAPVYPRYSPANQRSGSARSVEQPYTEPGQYNCNFGLHDSEGHTEYFISFHRFAETGPGPDRSRNYKIMSLRAGSATHWEGPPVFRHDMYPQTTSGHSYLGDCDDNTIGDTWANGHELEEQSWERFDYHMNLDQGAAGSGNARYARWKDGQLRAEGAGQAVLGSCEWTNIYINGYFARNKLENGNEAPCNDGCPATFWVDDVYIDITQARVELCDTPAWSAIAGTGASCEIQVPVSWSDSAITVTANVGAFADEATAYLYVIDGEGRVNETGFATTVSR